VLKLVPHQLNGGSGVSSARQDHMLEDSGRQLHSGHRIRSNIFSSSGPSAGMILESDGESVFFSSSMASSLCDGQWAMSEARAWNNAQEKGGGSQEPPPNPKAGSWKLEAGS
jgi:hypothetical protein